VTYIKINEVETLAGITKKNIRFYEQEGLLHPKRNQENGYRDYSDADVRVLQQIKLLRKIGLPLEEIRKLQSGALTIEDAMNRHCVLLERQQKNLEQSQTLCQSMATFSGTLADLAPEPWLEQMEEMEKEGTQFMNVHKQDYRTRYIAPAIWAGIMILFVTAFIILFTWLGVTDAEFPLLLTLVLDIPLLGVIVGIIIALTQRIQEIKGGEIDAASKY
jgi:DNA-binding transcriptional MerR regulator